MAQNDQSATKQPARIVAVGNAASRGGLVMMTRNQASSSRPADPYGLVCNEVNSRNV
jgi:hypothetical protein